MIKNLKNKRFELTCLNINVKEIDDGLRIEGFANTTTKDRVGDVILEEAWTKGGMDNYLKNPIVLAYHNPTKPIGEVVDYGVNNKGLHVIAEISKAAGDVFSLIKEGVLKAFSVGFMVKDADYDTETDIFVIKDLELYELSVVSIPANADSIFSVKKSFDNEEDYLKFKKQYAKDQVTQRPIVKEKKTVKDDDNLSLTPEELEAEKAKAVKTALDAIEAEKVRKQEIQDLAVSAGTTGAEALLKEFETRMAEKTATVEESLEGLRTELKEKNEEIIAMQNSKMQFNDRGDKKQATAKEIDTAVLAAKILGVPVTETKYFEDLKTKLGDHLGDVTGSTQGDGNDWETEFSTRVYEDIKDKTIIEPLFNNKITMTSRSMVFPYNPEAGYAEWVADTAYKTTDGTSTGTAAGQTHLIKDNTLKAEKLASKEFIGYEEEEDAIIPLVPIIQAAVVRRMVRSTDTELLRANAGAETETGIKAAPTGFNGVSVLATDAGIGFTQAGAFGSGNPVTISDLQQTRRSMGVYGLLPGNIVYVVSEAIMYDLLEDPDFRTMEMVGTNATILRGQIGSVNGSPVVVSDGFATYATATVQAICLNNTNYLLGELRGLMVERDRDIINQKNVLIATRRIAFTEIVPAVASTKGGCSALTTA